LAEVRWAIIGTGTMAETIAAAIVQAEGSSLRLVVGRTEQAAL
jgi:pyrroline-5-carboxylate reductase